MILERVFLLFWELLLTQVSPGFTDLVVVLFVCCWAQGLLLALLSEIYSWQDYGIDNKIALGWPLSRQTPLWLCCSFSPRWWCLYIFSCGACQMWHSYLWCLYAPNYGGQIQSGNHSKQLPGSYVVHWGSKSWLQACKADRSSQSLDYFSGLFFKRFNKVKVALATSAGSRTTPPVLMVYTWQCSWKCLGEASARDQISCAQCWQLILALYLQNLKDLFGMLSNLSGT